MPPSANRLNFTLSAEQIATETERLIAQSRATQDAVAALPASERTLESVVLALADDEADFSTLTSNVVFPGYVHPDKAVRDAGNAAQERIQAFEIESGMRQDIYEALLDVKRKHESSPLDSDHQRLLDRMLRDFERLGLSLPIDKRERVRALKERLSSLTIAFQKNLNEDNTVLNFTRSQLEGLPDDFIDALPRVEQEQESEEPLYSVSLRYPDLMPVMMMCRVEDTRRKLEFANSSKCMQENVPLFEEAIAVRRELAGLLGHETHAHYVLQVRMAEHPDRVAQFLHDLRDRLAPHGKKELAALSKLKQQFLKERGELEGGDNDTNGKINAWDFNFYHTLLKEREHQLNETEIAQYFPLPVVLEGMLQFVQETFGFKFERQQQNQQESTLYHEDIQHYHVLDADTGAFVGEFYLDLFPRNGKYPHFAAFPLQCAFERSTDGKRQHAISAMVCNFTRPTADKPSLLKHSEVVTLLHEFGHLQHGFSSRARFGRFSGTSVERDFVEAPSQMMESWCYEREFLRRISRHHETGEPLPDRLIDSIIAAKNVDVALLNLRQLFFGIFDLECHMLSDTGTGSELDSAELYSRLREQISLIPNTEGTNPVGGFGHLMGGYDVGYYGYLWSEVFAADIFSMFKEGGLFSPEIGKRYRQTILERGGMRDGGDMLRDFLQREPNSDAFMKSLGLDKEE